MDVSADIGQILVQSLPRMRRYALAVSRDSDVADELVQSACERALKASYPTDAPVLAWLFTIIRNLWMDRLRRKQVEGFHTDIDEHAEIIVGSSGEDQRADARQQIARVQDALLKLPVAQRELLLLVCVEELSYKDAAAVLNVPLGTVMSRLARARIKLAELTGLTPPHTAKNHD